ncbi:Dual specificity mitogen-activated protein kinase kinase 5 [Aphelenchoides fujianensis]|nr:Dual specificity mitogen-activated protein kinase kinase 5 [Aphelenchoides fujianensis]
MSFRVLIVCDKKRGTEFELEVDEVTLMFLDTLMAQLNAGTSGSVQQADYFEYEDEDGEWLSVRTDEELNSMIASTSADEPIRIALRSTKPTHSASTSGGFARIAPGQLHRLERLGSGQFGTVYRAIDEHDRDLAVKCIADTGDHKMNMSLLNEIEILKKCQSPYIVKFYGASLEEGEWLIRLELMDGLSLDRYPQLPPEVVAPVVVAVANGLKYLWDLKVMHRDVKPSEFPREHEGRREAHGLRIPDRRADSQPSTSASAGPLFQEFINKCLQFDPNDRFKPDEILAAPFVVQNTPMNKQAVAAFVKQHLQEVFAHN